MKKAKGEGDGRRRLAGVIAGGGAGVLIFALALQRDYHILAAVAAGPGVASGLLARRRSYLWGVGIGIFSLALAVIIEWAFLPLARDDSIVYFLTHLGDLPWKVQVSMALAAPLGFYFGMGRSPKKKSKAAS